ncbi:unnamed protein product [Debaryomyces tyrocola]|nr:unnamed protein product [Debaryomyces tyrocola]
MLFKRANRWGRFERRVSSRKGILSSGQMTCACPNWVKRLQNGK